MRGSHDERGRRARRERADDGEFEHAYESLFLPAMRLAFRLTGDAVEAEDVAAEAMARAYARWDRVRQLEYREAWVMRVAANVALDVVRRRRPAFEAERRLRVSLSTESDVDFDEITALRLALVAALRTLSSRQRDVIVLHYFSGLSDDDISSVLGIASSSVRTHLQRGLTAMRRHLPGDFEGSGRAPL